MVLWLWATVAGALAAEPVRPTTQPAQHLPATHLAIARAVAGDGLPLCRQHLPDGTEAPCLPSFAVKPGGAINARSRGGQITFTRGATTRLTADEFALLAGHEIAHWYLGHTESNPANEYAADRLGAVLACRAGYDVARGASLFRFIGRSRAHPAPRTRREAVEQLGGCALGQGKPAMSQISGE
jgi:Zn-dependent protease with chaperone function